DNAESRRQRTSLVRHLKASYRKRHAKVPYETPRIFQSRCNLRRRKHTARSLGSGKTYLNAGERPHESEVAGKLQSPGMPFPKMLRVAAQARPYLDWRWTGPAPCGRSPPGLEGDVAEVSQEPNLHKDHQRQRAHKFAKENLNAMHYCREGKLRQY